MKGPQSRDTVLAGLVAETFEKLSKFGTPAGTRGSGLERPSADARETESLACDVELLLDWQCRRLCRWQRRESRLGKE